MRILQLPINYERATPEERRAARVEYVRQQNGKCYFCHELLVKDPPAKLLELDINWSRFPEHFQVHPVHLQHNHQTGMSEGAVHMFCNAFMFDYLGR